MRKIVVLLLLVSTALAALPEDMLTLVASEQQTFPATLESGYGAATLQVSVKNNGDHLYTNLVFNASFSEPFSAINNSYTIGQMAPGETYTVLFTFNVGDGTAGTYSVPIWITYYDATAEGSKKVYRTAYLAVSTTPRLEIHSIEFSPSKIFVGSDFAMNITLTNAGRLAVSGIYLNVSVNNSYVNFITPIPKYVPTVLPGQSMDVLLEGTVSAFSPVGGFTGEVMASFSNRTVSSDFVFPIEGRSDLSVFSGDAKVEIGKSGNFSFAITNLGKAEFSDVRVQIESNTSIFVENQLFVGDIAPGKSRSVTLRTLIDRKTTAGIYPITIVLNSSQGERREKVNLDVYGVPSVRFAGVTTDETAVAGRKVSLSMQLENIGTDNARALVVRLRDAPVTGNTESHVGTIDVDDTGSAVFDVTFTKAGNLEIPAEIEFLDNKGNLHNVTLIAQVYVANASFDLGPLVILLVIFAIAGYYFYQKKAKRAKIAKI